MICVERLNGEILYLNWLQVELIEQIPETKIRMMNGDYYLVKDSVESIKDAHSLFAVLVGHFHNKNGIFA